MLSHTSRSRGAVNTWPGFVDALASVLMIFIFMLLVFVVAQFFLSDLASNRFGAIEQLSSNVNALLDQLAVEKDRRREMRQRIDTLGTELDSVRSARDRLAAELETSTGRLAEERGLLRERRLEVASLQQDIAALRAVRDELEARVAARATAAGRWRRASPTSRSARVSRR